MELTSEQLKKILVEPGFLSPEDFQNLEKQAQEENKNLEELIISSGKMSDEQLGQLKAEFLGYPFVNLKKEIIKEDDLNIIPEVVAKKQKVMAFGQDLKGMKIKLAMNNPGDLEIISLIEKKTGFKVIPYYATEKDLKENLVRYKKGLKQEFQNLIEEYTKKAEEEEKELPIIKILDTIINYAYQNRVSDIHFEPFEKKTVVRFRIDGILHDVLELPKDIHDYIISRIKLLAKLRTDEHFAAQDGRFSETFENEKVDIRVSIVPVTKGEKAVLRLLSEKIRRFNLEDLGFLAKDEKVVRANIEKPWGMILATGPTGCGKTTTLYAILKILNKRDINIATIEDPVEYDIEGVNQIQVNPKTNLTFAQGLRALVRQDPDILMVGEIRDQETAGIAVNAALTGHLVLSTMHTNDAPTTIVRLMDMGIEPFLIASTVNVIIAQRLVRLICRKCIVSEEISQKEFLSLLSGVGNLPTRFLKSIQNKEKIRIYHGLGCEACHQTGYAGRTGIFEVLEPEEEIKERIMQKANTDEIRTLACQKGMTTMIEDGLEKVFLGLTTVEEVLRVTK
ncbi:MAG: type II/IV secretion system protein [Patescibacteria group bacterium]|nr:type II/IV secretion system protein [Patescibacteria group bacterium]